MKLLVTGGTGFIGSFLCKELLSLGHEVAITTRNLTVIPKLAEYEDKLTLIHVEYKKFSEYSDKIAKFNPEVIFHLGWSGVKNSMHNDVSLIEENIQITIALSQLALALKVKAFIALGSQAEYGLHNCIINEKTLPEPRTAYGIGKLCAMNIFQKEFTNSSVRFVWLRLFSSYGPNDNPHWLIPYLIKSFKEGTSPKLTLGEQIWDYIFVSDVVDAIIESGFNPNLNGVYNLGSGIGYSLREVIEKIHRKINPKIPLNFGEIPYRENQVMVLQADISKLRLESNWYPKINLDIGLEKTIKWYSQNE